MDRNVFFCDLEIISKVLLPENVNVLVNASYTNDIEEKEWNGQNANVRLVFNRSFDSEHVLKSYSYILDFTNSVKIKNFKSLRVSYINNPDGTIRWMYPETNVFPGFLNFYSSSTLKAKTYIKLVKQAFKFGFKNKVRSGIFTLLYQQALNPIIESIHDEKKSFSIFTGTIGLSRKIQLEVHNDFQTEYFIKLPFTDFSKELIRSEIDNLNKISKLKFSTMQVPALLSNEETDAVYSMNIKKENAKSSNYFTSVHAQALEEMYRNSAHQSVVHSLECMEESIKRIYWLNQQVDFKFDKRLLSGLNKMLEVVSRNRVIPSGQAHKDFTPWNMFTHQNKLYVFDWEASEMNIPLLYDFFHFHFQTGILVQRKSFQEIIVLIQEKLKEPELQNMCLKYAIDTELHLALYLIINVSEFLVLYQKQGKLHMQVQWLTQTWKEAIQYVNINYHKEHIRSYFIQDFISSISNLNYAWMKYEGKKLSEISEDTDMDLLVDSSALPDILAYIKMYEPFAKIKSIHKSNMTTVSIYFNNQDFLSIDLIYAFKRNQYQYINPEAILQLTCVNADKVKVPQRHHDFLYILLFYTLNKSAIPEKYFNQFHNLLLEEQKGILSYVNEKYSMDLKSLDELMQNNLSIRPTLLAHIKAAFSQNHSIGSIKSLFQYVSDTLKEYIYNQGFIMTISGVDGAGKSTVIESLKEKLQTKFRKKVKILRHRPSVFPILSSYVYGKKEAEQKAANTLPRQGNNKSVLGSIFRFSYYYLDYQIGQIYIYFKYVCRGYIVIYDRYYFDFIQDSKRTNINLPPALTGFLYRFIYKPKLNVLLYADPQVILKRKQELTEQEITEMTYSYRKLFGKLAKKYERSVYLTIENIHKEVTIKEIIENYCEVA